MGAGKYQRLIEAVNKIHRTTLAPESWPRALEAIADCLESSGAVMYSVDLRRGCAYNFKAHNIDPNCQAEYLAHYHKVDPWLQIAGSLKPDRPFRGTGLVPDSAMQRTEHYNDFLKPQDIRFLLTGIPFRSEERLDVLSLFHGVKQTDFDDESVELYRVLLSETAQVMRIQETIGELKDRARGLAGALDGVPRAVVLLHRDGRVIHANSAALDLLTAGEGLSLVDHRIEASAPDARRSLERLMQTAVDGTSGAQHPGCRTAAIPRPSGRRAYVVRTVPLDSRCGEVAEVGDMSQLPGILMTISDPERRQRVPPAADFQPAYGFTPAEASLAVALIEGKTLSGFAVDHRIAIDTARKRLKSVMQKTGTNRQAELVRRLVLDMG